MRRVILPLVMVLGVFGASLYVWKSRVGDSYLRAASPLSSPAPDRIEPERLARQVQGASWTPPIGIPAPEFGIKERAPASPAPWDKATVGFYYVASDRPGATDENNPYGWPGRPRKTIPLTLPAGSVVELHGTYSVNHEEKRLISAAGTQSSPVWIRGVNVSDDRPVVTRSMGVYGSYAVIENIFFDHRQITASGEEVGIGLPNEDKGGPADCSREKRPACADHIVFRHNELRGSIGPSAYRVCGAFGVGGWVTNLPVGSSQHHAVFWDNYIHDEGQMEPLRDDDQSCSAFDVGRYASHVWIVDNRCFNIAQSCVQIVPTNDGSAYNDTHHIYVGRNESNRASKNAFWVKAASDVVFSQNLAHDTIEKTYNPATAFGLQYGPQRVWFLFNEAYNVSGGIWMAGDSNGGPDQRYFLIGNVIHDISGGGPYFSSWKPNEPWSPAAIFDATGSQVYIVDNLIWNLDQANGVNKPPGGGPQIIENNIIGGLRRQGSWSLLYESSEDMEKATLDFNSFDPVRVSSGGQAFNSVKDLQSTGKCKHCISGEPAFVDAANRDFTPARNSVVVGKGTASPVYDIFQKLYGLDIRRDFKGVPRTSPWSIGPLGTPPPISGANTN